MTTFSFITLTGKDAHKFLQGQLTINADKLTATPQACAISDLKGRVHFGLWASCLDDTSDNKCYQLITADNCMADLTAHIKKYGAFSKFVLSEPASIHPVITDGTPSFAKQADGSTIHEWQTISIATGNYWITHATQGLYQPQELRLHQQGGVDYDKGCYLGQEVIARLYFKAAPKAYLHRVRLMGDGAATLQAGDKLDKVQIVNIVNHHDGAEALVIGTPDNVANIGEILPLPPALSVSVAREK
ncbi:MAG: folate-binding Fe/S cluster repair protein [Moraxella sp.]|nr:folate-binding Fe/S cluster repair protein [Moraxella sp.]